MAKVFTIAEGLENLGALKTGGQGSVYKAKRMSEVVRAIKLLPTPILSEDINDKNYKTFVNEVEKLKRVNEEHNPNVVSILGSGITDTGGFPYIEMEFIQGPDLSEMLAPPHDALFSVQEVIRVASHISHALAHCHRYGIRHGDIKSNNIKYNQLTGNYVLLDFGLAMMSDDDRRTSLRYAGAIEFMAPEQNKGDVFFETDVYSFGVILFELLAGRVPFPLHDSGETARNAVMLSHMETPPPPLLSLRRQNMPEDWLEKKPYEAEVPQWLLTLIYKCLEKKPEDRFRNGEELHQYILENSAAFATASPIAESAQEMPDDAGHLSRENEELKQLVLQYQKAAAINEEKINSLQHIIRHHESLTTTMTSTTGERMNNGISKKLFYAVVLLFLFVSAGLIYTVASSSRVDAVVMNASPSDSLLLNKDSLQNAEAARTAQVSNGNLATEKLNMVPNETDTSLAGAFTGTNSQSETTPKLPARDVEVDTSNMIKRNREPKKQTDTTGSNKKTNLQKRDTTLQNNPGQ